MRVPRQRMIPLPEMGPIIRGAREALGWSERQLARRLGIGDRYVRYLEHGDRCPSADLAMKLTHVLNVDIPLPPPPPRRRDRNRRSAPAPPPAAQTPAPPPPTPLPRFINGYRPSWW